MGLQNLSKSVKICQSYWEKFAATFFMPHSVYCSCRYDIRWENEINIWETSYDIIQQVRQQDAYPPYAKLTRHVLLTECNGQ